MPIPGFHDNSKVKVIPITQPTTNDENTNTDTNEPSKDAIEYHVRGGFCNRVSRFFRSITFMFIAPVIAIALAIGLGQYYITQGFTRPAIYDLVVRLEYQQLLVAAQNVVGYLDDRQSIAKSAAMMISNGLAPYFSSDPDIGLANTMAFTLMGSQPGIYIFTVMNDPNNVVGYSVQNGNRSALTWFGKWQEDNLTTNQWYIYRWTGQGVNVNTGAVNFSVAPAFKQPSLIWSTIYAASFSGPNASVPLEPYFYGLNPNNPNVDNFHPEQGILMAYVCPFVNKITGVGGMAAMTFSSTFLQDVFASAELHGGIMYMTDSLGYVYASSLTTSPIYGPNSTNEVLPQTTGVVRPYGQFNYSNFPNEILSSSGNILASEYGSYKAAPDVSGLTFDIGGTTYEVSSTSFISGSVEFRIVVVVPLSSFTGFLDEAAQNNLIAMVALISGCSLLGAAYVYFFVVKVLLKETDKVTKFASPNKDDPHSVYYRPIIQLKFDESYSTRSVPTTSRSRSAIPSSRSYKDIESGASDVPTSSKINQCIIHFFRVIFSWLVPYEISALVNAGAKERSIMKGLMAYTPRAVVEQLAIDNRDILKPKMEVRTISILFTDIADWSGFCANYKQESNMIGNEYMSGIKNEVEGYFNGTIMNDTGDGIFAAWNAPKEIPDHAIMAVDMAFSWQEKLDRLNQKWRKKYKIPKGITMRYGFHVGEADVGNRGDATRMVYTATGPAVNMASRFEALNKEYHTTMLCSGESYEQIKRAYLCRFLEKGKPPGAADFMYIYEIVCRIQTASEDLMKQMRDFSTIAYSLVRSKTVEDIRLIKRELEDYHEKYYGSSEYITNRPTLVLFERCVDILDLGSMPTNWNGGRFLDKK